MKQQILSFLNRRGVKVMSRHGRASTDPFMVQEQILKGRNPRVVFDCGAHHGNMANRYRKMFPEATVYAFEPTPSTFSVLRDKVAADPKIVPVHAGVGDRPGKAKMGVYPDETCNTLLDIQNTSEAVRQVDKPQSVVEVDLVTLDAFCQEKKIDAVSLLKMDIEGFELPALRGATGLLTAQAIDIIYTEVRLETALVNGTRYSELAEFLHGFGYRAFGLYNFFYDDWLRMDWGDAIFVSERCYREYHEATPPLLR